MKNDKNPIEQAFGKLSGFVDIPDSDVWSNIVAALDKKKSRRKLIARISFIILIFFVSIRCFLFIKYDSSINNNLKKPNPVNQQISEPIKNERSDNRKFQTQNLLLTNKTLSEEVFSFNSQGISDTYSTKENSYSNHKLLQSKKDKIPLIETLGKHNQDRSAIIENLNLFQKNHRPSQMNVLLFNKGRFEAFVGNNHLKALNKGKIATGYEIGLNYIFRNGYNYSIYSGLGASMFCILGSYNTDNPITFARDSIMAINMQQELFYFKYYDTSIVTEKRAQNNNSLQVSIPFGLNYSLYNKGNFKLEWTGEIRYNRIFRRIDKTPQNLGSKTTTVKYKEQNYFSSPNMVNLSIGFKLSCKVMDDYTLSLTPVMSYFSREITNSVNGKLIRPVSFGIKLSISNKTSFDSNL